MEKWGVSLSLLMLAYALFSAGAEYYTEGMLNNDTFSIFGIIIAVVLPVLLFLFPPGEEEEEKYWKLFAIALFFHLFKVDFIPLTYLFLSVGAVLDVVVFYGFYGLVKSRRIKQLE